MNPFVEKIIPLILAFFAGIAFKKLKLLSKDDAPVLLRFVLTVTLPALTIIAISNVKLVADMIYIPFLAIAVVILMFLISSTVGKRLKMSRPMFGSFLVGTMIMNTAYSLPFFAAAFGNEGLARASLFDIGNTFMIFTFTYYNAIKYGENKKTDKIDWGKFLRLPPLWAMLIALGWKLGGVQMAPVALNFLDMIGQPTVPLVMIALGLYFEPKTNNLGKALIAVFIRMVIGLGIGIILATVLHLQGITRTVVIVNSALPIGFNTLIFANLENMDREFAATCVSISIFIALFYIPLLIYLFRPL
ncbi:MAG: AEC family transporter [Candidatus Cloacimonetes bacterium]|jgi:predicted permease|nr:AEC family transporter [Candidatus Cloacimonadota bacterium]